VWKRGGGAPRSPPYSWSPRSPCSPAAARRRRASLPAPALDVVALADPQPLVGFKPLPFSGDEARAVVSLARPGRAKVYVESQAVKERLLHGEVGEPRYLHLATHGFADDRYPELSGLVFAAQDDRGRARDGVLRAYEVARLRLRSDLVVLSACDSGLGARIAGEGLVGLPHKVLASLWPVNDPAAPVLMRDLYVGMLRSGLSPEAALRRAQIRLAAQPKWKQPYYWAGFVLIGAG
jgi:CHAT domain-containing protein